MSPTKVLGEQTLTPLADADAQLRTLDRKDWWRWVSVLAVTLLLTAAVFFMSLPEFITGLLQHQEFDTRVLGLLGAVLLFDFFAIYQQVVISRLRRQVTKQLGMTATLEMLQPPDPQTAEGRTRQRRFPRFHIDKRVSITALVGNKEVVIHGRTSDISEGGLGVVIPESLEPGTEMRVTLSLDFGSALDVRAVARHRRGFHHCIEFLGTTPEQGEAIRKACAGAVPMQDWLHGVAQS